MARRPVIAASSPRHEHDGEIGGLVVGLVGETDNALLGHGAALDIDGAIELAGAHERLPDLGEVAPDLHDHRGLAGGKPLGESISSMVPESTTSISSPQVIGIEARVQQPLMAVMPGITSQA